MTKRLNHRHKNLILMIGVAVAVMIFTSCSYLEPSSTYLLPSIPEASLGSLQKNLFGPKCLNCHNSNFALGNYDLSTYAGIMSGGRVIPGDPNNSLLMQRVKDGTMPPSGPLSEQEIDSIEAWILAGAPPIDNGDEPQLKAPVAEAGENQSVLVSATSVTLQGAASDEDGTVVSILWDQLSGPAATLADTNSLALVVTSLNVGTYTFRLSVTDNDNQTTSDTVQLNVTSDGTALPNPDATFTWISSNVLIPRCVSCHGAGGDAGLDVRSHTSVVQKLIAGDAARSVFYTEVNSGSMPEGSSKLPAAQIKAIFDWINLGAINN